MYKGQKYIYLSHLCTIYWGGNVTASTGGIALVLRKINFQQTKFDVACSIQT